MVEACRAAPDEFAAVLLDIRLPGPGCAWVLASLRSAASRVRRFLMSGNPGADDLTELESAGVDSLFARPFDMAALGSAVAAAVANRIGGEVFGNGA